MSRDNRSRDNPCGICRAHAVHSACCHTGAVCDGVRPSCVRTGIEEPMISGRHPVLLLLNGAIHTMDPDHPRAEAIAIDRDSGRILAVGDTHEMRSLAGPLTDTLDLGGRTVLPGFIDAHTHLMGYAYS